MAAEKRTKRRRNTSKPQKSSNSQFLIIGVGVLVVGLLILGMFQVLGGNIQASDIGVAAQEAGTAADSADPETRYLGAPSDPARVSLAEAGELGKPALVWFHADWCHVCQSIKPEVVDLGKEFEGNIEFVRLNVDHAESSEYMRRYGVRATPTFVLLDETGQIKGNVPGWPGYQAFSGAFKQLLTGSG